NPSRFGAYGVITEALILHKTPRNRYTIFPQLFIPWKPKLPNQPLDTRGSLPDFALGCYYINAPHIHLQGGCEVKKATTLMELLPSTNVVGEDEDVMNLVRAGEYQAEDQAKSAVKSGLLPPNVQLLWLFFIGPYFTVLEFGPFSAAQLATRGLKPNQSGDFSESMRIEVAKERPLDPVKLYLLGTPEAANALENFIETTSILLPAADPELMHA
ncbi:hypothetical protein AGABI1DRAFT_47413, partial [Agaricus bisporus var. burnettii JB137-S8]